MRRRGGFAATSIAGRACIAAVLSCTLSVHLAGAQIEAGRVVDDSTQQPILHVDVALQTKISADWKVIARQRTDSAGLFQFGALQPGAYRLAFSGPGVPPLYGPIDTLDNDSFTQRQYAMPATRGVAARVYFDFQVTRPVTTIDGIEPPPYPEELGNARIKGTVLAQFVVNADGTADPRTLKVLNSPPHRAFADAVYTYLETTARYHAATLDGVPVRQVVQQEFDFSPNPPDNVRTDRKKHH